MMLTAVCCFAFAADCSDDETQPTGNLLFQKAHRKKLFEILFLLQRGHEREEKKHNELKILISDESMSRE